MLSKYSFRWPFLLSGTASAATPPKTIPIGWKVTIAPVFNPNYQLDKYIRFADCQRLPCPLTTRPISARNRANLALFNGY